MNRREVTARLDVLHVSERLIDVGPVRVLLDIHKEDKTLFSELLRVGADTSVDEGINKLAELAVELRTKISEGFRVTGRKNTGEIRFPGATKGSKARRTPRIIGFRGVSVSAVEGFLSALGNYPMPSHGVSLGAMSEALVHS